MDRIRFESSNLTTNSITLWLLCSWLKVVIFFKGCPSIYYGRPDLYTLLPAVRHELNIVQNFLTVLAKLIGIGKSIQKLFFLPFQQKCLQSICWTLIWNDYVLKEVSIPRKLNFKPGIKLCYILQLFHVFVTFDPVRKFCCNILIEGTKKKNNNEINCTWTNLRYLNLPCVSDFFKGLSPIYKGQFTIHRVSQKNVRFRFLFSNILVSIHRIFTILVSIHKLYS